MIIEFRMHRDRGWLNFVREHPCMLRIPHVCTGDRNSSVPAHSNHQRHGRGIGSKSHDVFAVPACNECHLWYDSGKAGREEKYDAFQMAIERFWLYLARKGLTQWRPKPGA